MEGEAVQEHIFHREERGWLGAKSTEEQGNGLKMWSRLPRFNTGFVFNGNTVTYAGVQESRGLSEFMKIGGGFHLLFEMLGIDKENAETAQESRRSNKSGGGGTKTKKK